MWCSTEDRGGVAGEKRWGMWEKSSWWANRERKCSWCEWQWFSFAMVIVAVATLFAEEEGMGELVSLFVWKTCHCDAWCCCACCWSVQGEGSVGSFLHGVVAWCVCREERGMWRREVVLGGS